MEKITIRDNIKKLSATSVANILSEAKAEALKLKNSMIETALIRCEELLKSTESESKLLVEQKKTELSLSERQHTNKVRSEILDELSKEAIKQISTFEKAKLLDFVAQLILKEPSVNGTEIITVAKKDYQKFAEALASDSSKPLVDADLLNKKLNNKKFKLQLSKDVADIRSGFMLVGTDFDLNFDFCNLIENAQVKLEAKLSDKLF
ncbi:MAG: hypothetical protein FWE36_05295 [Erysipelotrichales bacterium]|nr:hypothetical protein [Erysipelotrichales bacterium]